MIVWIPSEEVVLSVTIQYGDCDMASGLTSSRLHKISFGTGLLATKLIEEGKSSRAHFITGGFSGPVSGIVAPGLKWEDRVS